MRTLMLAVLTAILTLTAVASQSGDVPYPDGYRDWRHVKSMVIAEGHPLYAAFGGIHHLYANELALQGYQKGTFPDGSVIVFDLLDAMTEGGATTEGRRKVLGVMQKDAKKWAATGGWGFEGFKGDSKTERAVAGAAASACFACHTSQKERDFVFSRMR